MWHQIILFYERNFNSDILEKSHEHNDDTTLAPFNSLSLEQCKQVYKIIGKIKFKNKKYINFY